MNARIASQVVTLVAASFVGAVVVGCSVQTEPSERTGTSDEALTCRTCLPPPPPPPYVPPAPTIANTTSPVCSSGGDSCGAGGVAVPSSLAGLGCTTGMTINQGTVWMCPASAHMPTHVLDCPSGTTEMLDIQSASFCSNCIGSPDTGWEIVADSCQRIGGHIGNGCSGPCGLAHGGI